jgi:hypothetical protein
LARILEEEKRKAHHLNDTHRQPAIPYMVPETWHNINNNNKKMEKQKVMTTDLNLQIQYF